MDSWAQKAVDELEADGWSLTAIAREIGTSVSSVSDLKQRRTAEPRGLPAIKLHQLHTSKTKPADKAA